MKTKIFSVLFLSSALFVALNAEAANCNFTRDLGQGSWGEDVRCLQQYLGSSGSGYYGAPYQNYMIPDGFFGPMTTQAVMQWQTTKSLPPTGYFDAASRAKYVEPAGGYGGVGGYYGGNTEEASARQRIDEALRMMEDTRDEIDDSNRNTSSAEDSLEDAEDNMLEAVHEFFVNRDFAEAYNLADDAYRDAEDAFEDAGGDRSSGDKEDAQDAINDAEDAINDAEDEIDDARRRGVSITIIRRAENFLDDAEDRLNDAEDEYDDKNYDDAEDFARDAENLAEDAMDEVN